MIKIKCALTINDKMNPGHLNLEFYSLYSILAKMHDNYGMTKA